MDYTDNLISEVLIGEAKPALGCTELSVIALASSLAFNAAEENLDEELKTRSRIDAERAEEDIERIVVRMSANVFKNAADAGVPGSKGDRGAHIASAMGVFGDPSYGLMIFESVSEDCAEIARKLMDRIEIWVKKTSDFSVVVEANAITKNREGYALITPTHTHVALVKSNGKTIYEARSKKDENFDEKCRKFRKLKVDDFLSYASNIPEEVRKLVEKGIEMNYLASEKVCRETYRDGSWL